MRLDYSTIGTRFIVGLQGPILTEEERDALRLLRPAGIIIFRNNIEKDNPDWMTTLRTLIQDARNATGRQELIVSIDHEGGLVHRLPEPITKFPQAMYWATLAHDVGRAMGQELRDLGFNLTFAPVLDIDLEPKNKVIGKRAFAREPERVIEPAIMFMEGISNAGILSCGKHFPGHGATTEDSHEVLPFLNLTLDELRNRELIPFQALANAGIPMLMTSHVLCPLIDPENPTSLSRTLITDVLRGELGYGGVVITDAIEMKALGYFAIEEVVVKALEAGNDLICFGQYDKCSPVLKALEVAQVLADEVFDTYELNRSQRRLESLGELILELDAIPPIPPDYVANSRLARTIPGQ